MWVSRIRGGGGGIKDRCRNRISSRIEVVGGEGDRESKKVDDGWWIRVVCVECRIRVGIGGWWIRASVRVLVKADGSGQKREGR
jgi:hypothetical protein